MGKRCQKIKVPRLRSKYSQIPEVDFHSQSEISFVVPRPVSEQGRSTREVLYLANSTFLPCTYFYSALIRPGGHACFN